MSLHRLALSLVLAGSALTGGAVSAVPKPKPVCNLVVDASGDAQFGPTLNSKALDIVSADVATGVQNLTAVIRVANLAPDTHTQQGKAFDFTWLANGQRWYLRVINYPWGDSWSYGTVSATGSFGQLGTTSGSIDEASNTVTFVLAKQSVGLKKGSKLSDLRVQSWLNVGALIGWDNATSTKTYVDGTRSCVRSS